MQFQLSLSVRGGGYPAILPINYQYPFLAAIYKIIQQSDPQFSAFLHDYGYTIPTETGERRVRFKLFTFSDINTPFSIKGDRMYMRSNYASVIVCFHLPEAAENFINGLFKQQYIAIADRESKVCFEIDNVQKLHNDLPCTDWVNAIIQPMSPMAIGDKNERGNYEYRSPADEDYEERLLYIWLEKYNAVYNIGQHGINQLKKHIKINASYTEAALQQRLITINNEGENQKWKIRAYTRFRLEVTLPAKMLQLGLNAGLGLHNTHGMGCIKLIKTTCQKSPQL